MSKKIALEIDVKSQSVGEANERMETAQQELRRLKQELASGELQGEAFDQAAARAGELRDRISDVNQRVNVLASDTRKLDAFVSVAQGIAGGFAAAQGAAALFGGENENLQKTFVKLQAAMATVQGIQAVANTLNKDSAASTLIFGRAKQALAASINGATAATKAFTAAMIAAGIGALVVAVGLLVANWEKLKAAMTGAAAEAKNFADSQRELAEESRDVLKNFDEQARTLRRLGFEESEIELQRQQAYEQAIKRTQGSITANQIAVMEAEKALEKVAKWEKFGFGLIPRLIYGDESDLEKRKKELEDSTKELEMLLNDKFDFETAIQQREERRRKMEEENAKKQREEAKKQKDKAQAEADAQSQKEAKERLDRRRKEEAELQKEVDEEIKERLRVEKEKNDKLNALGQEYLAKQKERWAEEERLKGIIQESAVSSLASLSQLFAQGSVAQKAFALSSIAADTGVAIGKALANSQSPTPDNIATGGLAGVAKYAAIAASILSGAAQARSVLKGGSVATAPQGRISTNVNIPQPPQQGVQGIRVQQPQRVYVLESDISRTQKRVNVIERNGVID